ncbi:MAG: filamentous hemagglutinin N-terminal domain-containing protein, partial [Burkholderiales bacterium]|nr:filamentous hemagglutinin N-terminal domain-containing protein [Burkholderiales bacterium]
MRPRKRAIAALLAMTAAAHGELARANPSGASVAAGAATIQSNGRTLTVTNAPGTIINWQAFSIGAGETTRFLQSSSLSAVLNRVTGGDLSRILGTLSSNGRVFLINPNGLVFGAGAVIDTAGFVASTLNIADRDFLAGRLKFEGGGAGVLRNEGTIRASGDIYLVGPRVENAGLIRSEGGGVALAAGQSVTITGPDAQGIQFALQAPADSALNLGSIDARTAAGMFAGTLRHSGDLRAMSASLDAAGRVTLSASSEAVVEAGATIAAGNAEGRGGSVLVWSDQDTRVHGAIHAPGGFVETSGRRRLDVSGIRLHAPGGSWLLDPYNIEVVAGAGTVNNGGAPAFTPGGDDSQIGADLITGQLDAGTSVTLATGLGGSPGTQAGNITVSSPVVKTAVNNASLTLTAANDIAVNANITLPGDNSNAIFNAGNQFSINSATVQAANVSVNAGGNITRSGAQASDFLYGRAFPETGSLTLSSTGGAIGAPGSAIRFRNTIDTSGRGWAAGTSAAGAAGDISVRYTGNDTGFYNGTLQTHAGTTQTVRFEHTGTGTVGVYSNITGNDDWIIDSAGNYGFAGATLTANSVNATFGGWTGRLGVYPLLPAFDTSAVNGNITLTARDIDGTGCGGSQVGVGVKPGTGLVSATATAPNAGCGGSIQLMHFGGDLLTSRYTLNFSNAAVPGNYMRLKAADGHLVVDSTAGFNASLNDKDTLLQTLTAGKDIIFQGGTVRGGRVEVRAARNIDNLAPGTDGFIQTNAFGGPHWMLIAGGGIGLTNPVEGKADWVGSAATSAAGAAGDINLKFTGGSPRFGEIRTHAGSAQNIDIQSTVGLIFSTAQPGYVGVGGSGSSSSTANDHYAVNAAGSVFFDNFDNSFTADTITMTSGGSIVHGVTGGGDMMATTGLLTMNANGGSIGSSGTYARLRGTGSRVLHALNNVYLDAGSNPLTLAGITTGASNSTIGVRTTGNITVDADITLPGDSSNAIFEAGNQFSINNATAQAANISVTAGGNISRSGAQASDFLFGTALVNGTLTLNSTGGAIGAPGNAIRFRSERTGIGFSATTAAPGAAGDIYLYYTGGAFDLAFAGPTVHTHAGTTQSIRLEHPSTGNISLGANMPGNDNWVIDSGGGYVMSGGTLFGNSVTLNLGGSLATSGNSLTPPQIFFDTSASNGNITLSADNFDGTSAGGLGLGVGVRPGTGIVTATSTGSGIGGWGTDGSILLNHYGGDLLTSRYNLNFTGGAAGADVRLKAADGHLIVDNSAGFNASLNNKNLLLQTLTAGKDIIFQGGTVQGNQVEVRATRDIDNLAPGTDGFIQTNVSSPQWMLVAGGGIGATNPVEGQADSYGSVSTAGAGAAGDVRIKFNGGTTARIAELRTAPGSAQNIGIESAAGLAFSTARTGYLGIGGLAPSSVTANDHYTINAAGSILFDNQDNSFAASTMTITSGGSVLENNPSGGDTISTTGPLTINANGGSIGGAGGVAGWAARLRGSGPKTLHARDNIYIDAGSQPLTLAGLTTGAGTGTISLTTTAANDLVLGGTTDIDDALVLNIGGNIIFPAAAQFTTTGGLTLNAPTQIASTAAVTVLGGSLGGSGAVTNAGTVDKAGAGAGDFSGGFTNTGSVNVNGSTLGFSGGYTDGGGALVLGSGGSVTAPAAGLVFNTGQLSGVGTVNGNLTNNGTLNVGLSPGTLTVNGNYTQGAGGILNIELGGTT